MTNQIPPKKSMLFIDGGNLLTSWWEHCKQNGFIQMNSSGKTVLTKKVSYRKLIDELARETDFIRGYYYDAVPDPIGADKEGFFDMLRAHEITVVPKDLKYKSLTCKHCKQKDTNIPYQKGVDVALVTDIMSLAFEGAYDIAVLLSGDNDFVDALKFVKGKGRKVWVASFRNCLGEDLMRVADKVIQIDKIFNEISFQEK